MRIQEIIQQRIQKTSLTDPELNQIKTRDINKPETGADATGWPSTDPHIWIKQTVHPTTLRNLKQDPTFNWIRTIEPYISQNPYLPRTYIIDLKTDEQSNIRPQYHTETLIHGTEYAQKAISQTQKDSPTQAAVEAMATRMWGNANWIKVAPFTITSLTTHTPAQQIWRKCCALVKFITENNSIPSTETVQLNPDPLLMQAIKLIQQVIRQNDNWITDLHSNNFMIRLGKTGPQMVINDPVTTSFSRSQP
jgi:hypothetical protein